MLNRHLSRRWYSALTVAEVAAYAVALALSGLLKADAKEAARIYAPLGTSVAKVQGELWIWLPVATAAAASVAWVKRKVGEPWYWESIHSLLDTFREQFFAARITDPVPFHRVTLFKRRSWLWTTRGKWWGGWVVPVERSGHTTQGTNTVFRATDDPLSNEGVAGVSWGFDRPVTVLDLPNVGEDANPTDQEIANYAKLSWVDGEWVRANRPAARSLLAFPVEVKNEPWGVIVLDSRDPQGIKANPESYASFAKMLGKLLERA